MVVLITGSGGLVGSHCADRFADHGASVIGIDNDMRQRFFGKSGSTRANIERLCRQHRNYQHFDLDICDPDAIVEIVKRWRPDIIIHAAAQPSHDLAASMPRLDFNVNATSTLNLLVAARDYCRDAAFIFLSTNKVYGDQPNNLVLTEMDKRFDYADGRAGIDESMSIDQCLHSLFGASKLAADVMCQEFGRYFDMPVGIFRCGCITGPQHAAVAQHGYLAYIIRCAAEGRLYTIHGYKGKQVRDQIHVDDLYRLFRQFANNPTRGEVYNVGGGRENSISILETIEVLQKVHGLKLDHSYDPKPRTGDHICYITDLRKVRSAFPKWKVEHGVLDTVREIINARTAGVAA